MDTWLMLERNALQKELNILRIMDGKHRLHEQSTKIEDYPNKYLDEELNYMKQIREAYFLPKPEELRQV